MQSTLQEDDFIAHWFQDDLKVSVSQNRLYYSTSDYCITHLKLLASVSSVKCKSAIYIFICMYSFFYGTFMRASMNILNSA